MLGGRVLVATILAVATGAVLLAAAGVGNEPSTPRPPMTLEIPAVRAGDAAVYRSVHQVELQGQLIHQELLVEFYEEPWFSPSGAVENRLVLRHAVQYWGWGLKLWLNGTEVLTSKAYAGGGGATTTVYATRVDQVRSGYYNTFETTHVDPLQPFCGLVHTAQGTRISEGARLTSPGCPSEMWLATLGNGTATFTDGNATLVEIGIAAPLPRTIKSEAGTWHLVAYERKDGVQPSKGFEPAPIEVQPGTAPDPTGISESFPYREALGHVLEAVPPNSFSSLFQRSPNAYVADAAFTEIQDGERNRLEWTLVASDGYATAAVKVAREGARLEVPQTGVSQPIGWLPALLVQDVAPPPGPYPSVRPSEFPSLAAVAQRWATHRLDEAPKPNAWGFNTTCGATCGEAATSTWFGLDLHRQVASCGDLNQDRLRLVCASLAPLWISDRLVVDGKGRSLRSLTTNWEFYSELSVDDEKVLTTDVSPAPSWDYPARTEASAVGWGFPAAPLAASATAVGVGIGLLYAFWPAAKFALAGLSKDAREPNNPVRASVLMAIQARPGTHYQELRRTLGKPGGTVRHHLRMLEHDGAIVSHPNGGYRCYFPAGEARRDAVAGAGVLKAESARRILHGLVAAGRLNIGQAAALAGVTASAATHHAARMEEAGLLTRTRAGREMELRPTGRARGALRSSEP